MSVIETLAYQQPVPIPAAQMREPIDDAETVFSSLAIEAKNELRVLEDQLSAVNACARELTHAWFASMDCMAMNGFEFLRKLARVESPEELARLQARLVEAQVAAFGGCCEESRRQIEAAMARCAHER